MDINFHYFAVKTIAMEAGFSMGEAQQIATYSQYVDDFDWLAYRNCQNIPKYITADKASDLYLPPSLKLKSNFNPNTTGFGTVSMVTLLLESSQKSIVSPFHFVPPKKTDKISKDSRTVPAKVGDGSLMSDRLVAAREKLAQGEESRRASLMRIGMMLHTFADSYAHQRFSGYNSWVNDVEIVSVKNNINRKDMTKDVLEQIGESERKCRKDAARSANKNITGSARSLLPCIGHMWAGDTPDRSNLSFRMKYREDKSDKKYNREYVRNNTRTFLNASRQILDYLRSCKAQGPISNADWGTFAEKLQKGFLVEYPTRNTASVLAAHWKKIFPKIQYNYDTKEVEEKFYTGGSGNFLSKYYTKAFYRHNYIANATLIDMYGRWPRG